jgi:hypothetical protein
MRGKLNLTQQDMIMHMVELDVAEKVFTEWAGNGYLPQSVAKMWRMYQEVLKGKPIGNKGGQVDRSRMYTHAEMLQWFKDNGITLTKDKPSSHYFETIKEASGKVFFRLVGERPPQAEVDIPNESIGRRGASQSGKSGSHISSWMPDIKKPKARG